MHLSAIKRVEVFGCIGAPNNCAAQVVSAETFQG
jgi:hypothetical protein